LWDAIALIFSFTSAAAPATAAVLGDHGRDALAEVAHLLDRNQVLDDRACPERGERRRVRSDVGARHDTDDAGERLGLRSASSSSGSRPRRSAYDRAA
jgi:hypothetical protein